MLLVDGDAVADVTLLRAIRNKFLSAIMKVRRSVYLQVAGAAASPQPGGGGVGPNPGDAERSSSRTMTARDKDNRRSARRAGRPTRRGGSSYGVPGCNLPLCYRIFARREMDDSDIRPPIFFGAAAGPRQPVPVLFSFGMLFDEGNTSQPPRGRHRRHTLTLDGAEINPA